MNLLLNERHVTNSTLNIPIQKFTLICQKTFKNIKAKSGISGALTFKNERKFRF